MEPAEKNEQGFTLIETIAVILLVGIISAVLGMAIVQGVKSYVFARTNVSFSQKAQLAMARMERELRAITEIDVENSSGSCIRYKRQTASPYFRTIGLNGTEIQINAPEGADADCPDTSPGHVLIDHVDTFSLQYEDDQGNLTSSPPEDPAPPADPADPKDLKHLCAIEIVLTLNRPDSGNTENFSLVINPRNNSRLNAPGSNN